LDESLLLAKSSKFGGNISSDSKAMRDAGVQRNLIGMCCVLENDLGPETLLGWKHGVRLSSRDG